MGTVKSSDSELELDSDEVETCFLFLFARIGTYCCLLGVLLRGCGGVFFADVSLIGGVCFSLLATMIVCLGGTGTVFPHEAPEDALGITLGVVCVCRVCEIGECVLGTVFGSCTGVVTTTGTAMGVMSTLCGDTEGTMSERPDVVTTGVAMGVLTVLWCVF